VEDTTGTLPSAGREIAGKSLSFLVISAGKAYTFDMRNSFRTDSGRCGVAAGMLFYFLVALAGLYGQSSDPVRAIGIAVEPDYPPYSYIDANGKPAGFSVELFKAVARVMNIELGIETGLWSVIKADLAEGRIDALPLVGRTPEREADYDFTIPYLSLYGGIVVRSDNGEIGSFADLAEKRVAVMKDDNAEEFLRRTAGNYQIITTPSFKDAMELLISGGCDAVIIQRLVGLRMLKDEEFTELKLLGDPIHEFRQDFCFAVQEGNKELLALLNEGLALVMADGTFRRLQTEWFAAMELPSRKIIVGGDFNYPPFEFIDRKGRPSGFTVDLTRAIAREMGLEVEIVLGPWTQMVGMLERGEIDIVQGMFYSAEREKLFAFSQAHTVNQNVVVSRNNEGVLIPSTVGELQGSRVTVQEGDIMDAYARKNGLGAGLVPVESQEEALRLVASGEADYALAGRLTAMYLMEKNGWNNLKAGRTPLLSPEYCYAVKNDNRTLLSYFSEGLSVLEKTGEYRRIYDAWLGVYVPIPPHPGSVIRFILIAVSPLLIILAVFLLWNRALRNQVARRTSELKESEKEYRLLSENTVDVIWRMSPDLCFRYINPAIELLTGYTPEEWIGTHVQDHCDEKNYRLLYRKIETSLEMLPEHNGFSVEADLFRKNREPLTIEIAGKVLLGKGGAIEGFQGIARDIGARKRYERSLEENFHRKQWLNTIATIYLSRSSPESLIQRTVEELSRNFSGLRVSYSTIDDNGIRRVVYSLQPEGMPDIRTSETDLKSAPAYLDSLLNKSRTVIEDIPGNALTAPLKERYLEERTFALAAVAVPAGEQRGLLSFHAPQTREWTEHELLTLEEHANLLTLILENERYQRMMTEANESLEASLGEKNTLLKEIHHRVKNNLNVIVSLLRLQEDKIDSIESAREAFEQSRNRIFSMALVHEALYRSDNLSVIALDDYIRSLISQLKHSAAEDNKIEYLIDLETISIDITRAVPCGIILNELVTNAQKHAFKGSSTGVITVSLQRADDSRTSLSVHDNGSGLPSGFSMEDPATLGLNLVAILTEQIAGELRIESRRGTKFEILFAADGE
jgi:PAS domain S-box-containing protein